MLRLESECAFMHGCIQMTQHSWRYGDRVWRIPLNRFLSPPEAPLPFQQDRFAGVTIAGIYTSVSPAEIVSV